MLSEWDRYLLFIAEMRDFLLYASLSDSCWLFIGLLVHLFRIHLALYKFMRLNETKFTSTNTSTFSYRHDRVLLWVWSICFSLFTLCSDVPSLCFFLVKNARQSNWMFIYIIWFRFISGITLCIQYMMYILKSTMIKIREMNVRFHICFLSFNFLLFFLCGFSTYQHNLQTKQNFKISNAFTSHEQFFSTPNHRSPIILALISSSLSFLTVCVDWAAQQSAPIHI